MKRLFTSLAAVAIISLAGAACAADGIKLASIDLGKVAQESKAGLEAKKDLEALKESLGKKIKQKEAELDKLKAALDGKGKKLTDKERSAKAKEFEKKIEAYREYIQNSQKELLEKGDKYLSRISDAIEKLVKEYALKNSYSLVIRKGGILYNDEKNKTTDISDDILKLYDAAPQDGTVKK